MKRTRRWKTVVMSIIMLISALSMLIVGVGCGEDESKGLAKVWSALPTEKFEKTEVLENYPEAKVDIVAIKGETESTQIMITANEYIKGYDVVTSDLTDESGNVFSKDNIKVYNEHYLEIYYPFPNQKDANITICEEVGWYPDALVPLDKAKIKREDRINAGENQGLWFDFVVPSDCKAGTYTGSIKLFLGTEQEEVIVPVTVCVYDILMPVEVNNRTHFAIWYNYVAKGEGDNYDGETTDAAYREFLLERRITSGSVNNTYIRTFAQYADYIVDLAKDPRVTCYLADNSLLDITSSADYLVEEDQVSLLPKGTLTDVKAAHTKVKKQLNDLFTAVLAKNVEELETNPDEQLDLFKKMIFYFEDEPAGAYRFARIKTFDRLVMEVKKEFIAANEETFNKYPFLKESLMNEVKDILPTQNVNSKLYVNNYTEGENAGLPNYEECAGTTLWCPEMFQFNDKGFRDNVNYRKQISNGYEDFWWYLCCSNTPAPSYYVEAVTLNIRMLSWMQYQYDITGTLYWQVAHFEMDDPYTDLIYKSFGAGEGVLVYPGARYGLKTPISSIRLENIFQGQEDYEYFYMLEQYITAYNTTNGTNYDVSAIIEKMSKGLYTGTFIAYDLETGEITAEPSNFEANRRVVLEILNDFASGKDANAIAKINDVMAL